MREEMEEMEEMELENEEDIEVIKENSIDGKVNALYAQDRSNEEIKEDDGMDSIYLQSELSDNLPIFNESAINYLMDNEMKDLYDNIPSEYLLLYN